MPASEQRTAVAPGLIALSGGSGETARSGRLLHEFILRRVAAPARVAILETPAGFQSNSNAVAARIGDFFRGHLQGFNPQVSLVPARRRGSTEGPDNAEILTPLLSADLIFMGPGSPTYAARHLSGTLAWQYVQACNWLGAALSFSSGGTGAVGTHALPVYEIYKAGEDLHWQPGLDLLGQYGLKLVVVPHWNNAEGGSHLDTSRCYMGKARMERLISLLPEDQTVVGIDEHTAIVFDISGGTCSVLGNGGVTLVRRRLTEFLPARGVFPIRELFPASSPSPAPLPFIRRRAAEEVSPMVRKARVGTLDLAWKQADDMVRERAAARLDQNWMTADALRTRIMELGYQVLDGPDGSQLIRA